VVAMIPLVPASMRRCSFFQDRRARSMLLDRPFAGAAQPRPGAVNQQMHGKGARHGLHQP
jgi:hypothetical protein